MLAATDPMARDALRSIAAVGVAATATQRTRTRQGRYPGCFALKNLPLEDQGAASGGVGPATPAPLGSRAPASGPRAAGGTGYPA